MMSNGVVRTILTALFAAALAIATMVGVSAVWAPLREPWLLAVVGGITLALGVVAGFLGSFDHTTVRGWAPLLVDHTWALPSTMLGAVVGITVYPYFGTPSGQLSAGRDWVSYKAKGTSGFGVDVLHTIGTVNIGGPGSHERVHLLQSRILGWSFLPIVGISYVVTTLLQGVWSLTLGLILRLAKVRDSAWFRPPQRSAVAGFWGWIYYATPMDWIYYATPMELWAYATEHKHAS